MAVSASKAASLLGQTLGHYRILEKIGAGGMGEVYRARDDHLNRDVAIKVLPVGLLNDEHARKQFRKEAEALSKLEHPNIATIHDFDTHGEVDFLVMEYIPGETVSNKLRQGSVPEKEVLRLGLQLTEGLSAAHEHGVIHCDLKPGNLRLTSDGRLKILDFGLAKLVRCFSPTATTESAPETAAFAGTLPYMAPEQLRGETVDQRTDVYGVGVVLYEMATGQRPFGEKVSAVLTDDILHQYPPPPGRLCPQLSPRLEDIILKCLEKDPENRYQSAKELAVDLRRLQSGAETAVSRGVTRTPRWSARSVRLALLLVASIITVLLAFNIGNLRQRLFHPGEAPRIKSLAVLPLANLSDDPQQEYFTDGMTEALIAELSQISSLKVISRTSVMHYKGSNKPLPQIARELNVDGIIEGSALRSGNRVRITAQLIQASSDTHVWGKSYERDLRDVLALQGEVAQAIAKEIKTNLTAHEHARLARARPVDPEAYELYLRGRYEWNKRTKASLYKALDHFRQAINLDPTCAQAYSGLADVYLILGDNGFLPGAEVFPKSKAAALKALELDENSAEAHVSLAGVLAIAGRDRTAALKEYETAIQLSPNYATAHHWYAVDLAYIGRSEVAIREIEQARRLDPLSVRINANVPYVYYLARQYDQAVAEAHKALELEPRDLVTHRCLGWIYLQKRMPKEALAEFEMELTLEPGSPRALADLALGYAVAGNIREAEKILAGLQQQSKKEYVTPYFMAKAYVGLGQKEQAVAWLQKGFEVQDAFMDLLKGDPALDPLRSDPRFQDLLRRMNFPE